MRKIILLCIIVLMASCHTAKIKNTTYLVSNTNVELGSIGQGKTSVDLKNDFEFKAFPKLENKIRLSVEIIPFDKKTNQAYLSKAQFNQNLTPINYIDSLPNKPELVIIRLMDVSGIVNELSKDYNKETYLFVRETKEVKMVSSIAARLSSEDIAKIKLADSYYLINNQEKKYSVLLFNQGKKTETIDINSGTVVSYRLSSFCWATNARGNWYIADMAEGSSTCKGNTTSQITEKEKIKNLYKM